VPAQREEPHGEGPHALWIRLGLLPGAENPFLPYRVGFHSIRKGNEVKDPYSDAISRLGSGYRCHLPNKCDLSLPSVPKTLPFL
jgi:hypothetical protein